MLYRIHDRLLVNSKRGIVIEGGEGRVHCLDGISKATIGILLSQGNISIVSAPPLNTFWGWELRAKRLEEARIDTLKFLIMSVEQVIKAMHSDEVEDWQPDLVDEWQEEIKSYLGIDNTAKTICGCIGK